MPTTTAKRRPQMVYDASGNAHVGYGTRFPISLSDEDRIRQAAIKRERKMQRLERISATVRP